MTDIEPTQYEPIIVTEGARHAIASDEGLVENVILWDGETEYDPGDEFSLAALADDAPVGPGDTVEVKKGAVKVLAKAEPEQAEPTFEDRLEALEAKA